jgi:2-methylisocitrate lyase-like PEP mutase family enzyme
MHLRAQKEKAEILLSLHTRGELLVLPNVWNPIGSRILEKKGYPAVATASAAISASLGYQDGEKIKRSTLIDLIERITRSVDVPIVPPNLMKETQYSTFLRPKLHFLEPKLSFLKRNFTF